MSNLPLLKSWSTIPPTPNLTLTKEREDPGFSVPIITSLLDGSPSKTARRRYIETIVCNDPVFRRRTHMKLDRVEKYKLAILKHHRMAEILSKLNIRFEDPAHLEEFSWVLNAIADDLPTMLHWVMFVPNILSLFDEEQKARLLPACRELRMLGCYAQTELGHGSNIRGLTTTATYNRSDDTFTINTPDLLGIKFWPGSIGVTANHAIVIANLVIDGKSYGNHNFLVQMREYDTHKLLPGVTTGDLGPKLGFNNMDNGFAIFRNVKIPRRDMAMRFSRVERGGRYIVGGKGDDNDSAEKNAATEKISHITMMQVRSHIIHEASKNLGIAATIAVRYSAVRLQGYRKGLSGAENQILDYKTQQHRLMPLLACAYCFQFTGRASLERLKEIEKRIQTGGAVGVSKTEMQDLHCSSSALKAFASTITADGIEDCRKCCGGNGYLVASGLPELLTTYLQNPTVEGDNAMLPQQVVKVLLRVEKDVRKANGQRDMTFLGRLYAKCDSSYLVAELPYVSNECKAQNILAMRSNAALLDAFAHRSARLLAHVAKMLRRKEWNECLVEFKRVSNAHASYLLVRDFQATVASMQDGSNERRVMNELQKCMALWMIERDMGDFCEDRYLNAEQISWVRENVSIMLKKLRPIAVPLVDAMDYNDFRLKSAIGRKDGNVYEALFATCLESPLNLESTSGEGFNITGVSRL